MKKMENRIDITKFTVNEMTFSKIDHILIKENLRISESVNFDEDDRDEKKILWRKKKIKYEVDSRWDPIWNWMWIIIFLSELKIFDRELDDDDCDKW